MKKILAFVFILIFLCPLLFGEASFYLGGIYDSYTGNDWGVEGSIDADFMRNASLSAKIDYRYNSNYSMSFTADYTPSIFILGGGLDFKINKNGVYPGLKVDLGLNIGDTFHLSVYGSLGINASNVRAPTMFELGLNSRYIASHAALQVNGYFTQENESTFISRNLSAEAAMTLYSAGFLYSLKTGAVADYSELMKTSSTTRKLSLKGVVGVGKNKDSGTLVVQFTFNIVSILGPKQTGFAVSIGKFPKKISYIY
jgi:hypothetical protein